MYGTMNIKFKDLYMFRALLLIPQDVLHKWHVVAAVAVALGEERERKSDGMDQRYMGGQRITYDREM
jgi:hypothetical protein